MRARMCMRVHVALSLSVTVTVTVTVAVHLALHARLWWRGELGLVVVVVGLR